MSDRIKDLERQLQEEKWKEYQKQQKEKQQMEKQFKEKNAGLEVGGSDYYYYCRIGDYDFYYGYEETHCPVKSHKTEDDCYEKDCDKREWCFVAYVKEKEVIRYTASELGDHSYCEQNLIAGILKSLHEGYLFPPK